MTDQTTVDPTTATNETVGTETKQDKNWEFSRNADKKHIENLETQIKSLSATNAEMSKSFNDFKSNYDTKQMESAVANQVSDITSRFPSLKDNALASPDVLLGLMKADPSLKTVDDVLKKHLGDYQEKYKPNTTDAQGKVNNNSESVVVDNVLLDRFKDNAQNLSHAELQAIKNKIGEKDYKRQLTIQYNKNTHSRSVSAIKGTALEMNEVKRN